MSIYYGGAALVYCIAIFTAATIDETIASERPSDPTPDVDASKAAWGGGGISTESGTNCTLTVSSASPAVRCNFLRGGMLINKAYKTWLELIRTCYRQSRD